MADNEYEGGPGGRCWWEWGPTEQAGAEEGPINLRSTRT